MNDAFIINGGNTLNGTIQISGAKNAALPLLAACLLSRETVTLDNMPDLTDIKHFCSILTKIGASITSLSNSLSINAADLNYNVIDFDEVQSMRASILLLGPLLTRFGMITLKLPGGCNIGRRPIDQHLNALRKMGADIHIDNGLVIAKSKTSRLIGADITLAMPTVTGTENIIMAAVLACGVTTIRNAAKEPEITDLIKLLNAMGAKIEGVGSQCIQITGVTALNATTHHIIPDRIETGTYLTIALATNSSLELINTDPNLLTTEIEHFRKMGANIKTSNSKIKITPTNKQLIAKDILTSAYPGFATDLQAPTMVVHALALGESKLIETVFDNRYHHVSALKQMGADINIDNHKVIVKGQASLKASDVVATDLRASASLVVAALKAEGESIISNINYIDRGYSQIDKKLKSIGADINRVLKAPLPKEKSFATNTLYA